jgi:DNA repair photolyase
MLERLPDEKIKGRGAVTNVTGRFEGYEKIRIHDGWDYAEDEAPLVTSLIEDKTRTIIATNDSPDIGFNQSINMYRGCEHGCIYCFARPTHAYLGLSPGLDFESRLFFKPHAGALLEKALRAKSYTVQPIALGTNTDPDQPVEREKQITRQILQVLARFNHPVTIVTKSALVTRDLDILAPMAAKNLARVALSITTLDPALARSMEPRAASPARRLATVRELAAAGVPVTVMAAPMIPALNDQELEAILAEAAAAGAKSAGTLLVRMPHEIKQLFEEWLRAHAPGRADHVLSLMRQAHGGKLYNAEFGVRQRGTGPYAELLQLRFRKATARLGLNVERRPLDCGQFKVPPQVGDQLSLSL